MLKFYSFIFLTLACVGLMAQTTATFENFDLPAGSFLNGSDGSGGFASGNVFLPNDYNEAFNAWSGWALSSMTDNTTPSFTNQYSAVTGGGYGGSVVYAVTFASPGSVLRLEAAAAGGLVEGLFITNSTYAYYSMLNGDAFAKRFGGETGDDPDFFRLTVRKYLDGALGTDSVDFYLADYRFADNEEDYIVDEWTYLDLSSLGNADSLLLTLTSTDVGQFGMNTPAYFCVDNVITADRTVSVVHERPAPALRIFPNPTVDLVTLDWAENREARLLLSDASGRAVRQLTVRPGLHRLELQALPRGIYYLQEVDSPFSWRRMLVKQ